MIRQTSGSLRWFALLAVTAAVSLVFLDTVQTFLVALVMAAIAAGLAAPLQARMMITTCWNAPIGWPGLNVGA